MKAAVFYGNENIRIEERNFSLKPSANEVMIRVKSTGICGTDLQIYKGNPGSAEVHPPIILGHELSGEVVDVGNEVHSLNVKDRVSIDPNIYCGTCEFCRTNRSHLCNHMEAIGVTRHGGMGEYCLVPKENCYRIPDEMTYEEAALVEPLGCVLHGMRKIKISSLSRVAIIGGGFIGQLFLQLVKHQHVDSVIVSEPDKTKWKLLRSLGADHVIDPSEQSFIESVAGGVDVVIECVGKKDSMETSVQLAKKGGQILLFGVASPQTKISISPFEIFNKELSIYGSFVNPYTHQEAISLINKKVVKVIPLITHRFELEEIPDVMKDYPQRNISKALMIQN